MQVDSQASVIVRAEKERVWEEFCRFERWPDWSSYFRLVMREGEGWRFVHRSAQDVDLSFVLVATQKQAGEYIEFATDPSFEHNAVVRGWVEFKQEEGHTRINMAIEGEVIQPNGFLKSLSDWWSQIFVEPGKNLKVILEDFKAKFEGYYDKTLEINQPAIPSNSKTDQGQT
jgi:hypothetical protein